MYDKHTAFIEWAKAYDTGGELSREVEPYICGGWRNYYVLLLLLMELYQFLAS